MSAEYTYYIDSLIAEEPVTLTTAETLTVVIVNTGDEAGVDLGFYLKDASSLGPFEYPSSDAPSVNLYDMLSEGEGGYGITITQNSVTTRFDLTNGSNYFNRIPLTVGSGDDSNQLAIDEEISVVLTISFTPALASKNFYVDLVLE